MLLRASSLAVILGALASAVAAATASSWPVDDITLSISDKARVSSKDHKLNYPYALSETVQAQANEVLKLTFKVGEHDGKKALPHQAMIRFQSQDDFADSIMIGGSVSKTSGRGRIEIDFSNSKTDERFKYNTRKYSMELLIGGYIPSLESFKYDLGTVEIHAPSANPAIRPVRIPYTAQPEIHHQFRADQKLINIVISGTFTVLVLTPWAILLGLWAKLGIRFEPLKQLAHNPLDLVMASVFFASLVGIEYIFYAYWTGITLFPTLQHLGIVTVITAVSGRSVLSAAQKRRLQRTSGDKEQ